MKLLICFAIYLQVPEGQVSPSSCAGHGIWLKHIGQECEPAILGAPHPCSSTKHIPASKNLLWAFSPPSYCLCRPALVCRNNREALWALNTQHCCFAVSNLSIGFSNSIFFTRTDWTILAYMSVKFASHMTYGSRKFCQWVCNSGGKILLNFKPDPHTAELLLPGWALQRSIKPNKVTYLLWNSSLLSSRRIWCTGWACQIHAAMHMASGGFNSLVGWK